MKHPQDSPIFGVDAPAPSSTSNAAERERHQRIAGWFSELYGLEGQERRLRLEQMRAEDPVGVAELEELMQLDSWANSTLDRELQSPEVSAPERIGEYRILGELGRGGMGVVWLAEQERPKREVALKVLRPGLWLSDSMGRFGREAEALARLNHPCIAQVYGAGTAEQGGDVLAYLAMERVEGQRLGEWGFRATINERLELLARVSDAIEHAHAHGVMHRDLKPSNILVTVDGTPKVLDFGVARVTQAPEGGDDEQRPMTVTGDLVGTLPYMSPEQVLGNRSEIDERSDVYGLGVLAYELLAGRMPYDVTGLAVHKAAARIIESEPTALGRIDPRLAGDVETVVGKALEKEPRRRYQSARAFGDDLRRHLDQLPIQARPSARLYRGVKSVRRHRALVGACLECFGLLAAGAVGMAWKAREAERYAALCEAVQEPCELGLFGSNVGHGEVPTLEPPSARVPPSP